MSACGFSTETAQGYGTQELGPRRRAFFFNSNVLNLAPHWEVGMIASPVRFEIEFPANQPHNLRKEQSGDASKNHVWA